ncbi:4Fe-4S cluster-binding domain-containing protein [Parabacteroides acidifaciens]|uniref:4Fe-4S cluster-binding domain-containing protein n=1 Tax=Parabacteroides acidifaciens TaxID=2290935 RepID=A0A3D8HGG3_9BACT|nr:radical SAM protein [Parabacteroides acidifaciens]MBC8601682.1 4Fe-4S cluster-binding domain-containing protein [Parabacteroides acidifaciens]RDU49667.1 4Fe-4S cluster-binding domain-containing protein [Parabacteroides acidifaciens]
MIRRLPKAKIVTLFITYGCNLNCVYCFEQYKDARKKMPLELAKDIILKEFEVIRESNINDAMKIDLFGGEPLLNFSFIREFCEWLWAQDIEIPYIIYATTNGTLLDAEKQEWFRMHKDDFVLVMSVDGDSAMQLENRGCRVEQLPMEFAHELWPDQALKMTISSNTLPDLSEGIISLRKKGYLVESRLAQGESWKAGDDAIYKRELIKIAEFYLQNPNYLPGSLFTRYYGEVLHDNVPLKFCGTGTNMVAYDVEGKKYPCHMFAPLVLGVDAREEIAKIDFHDPNELVDDSCKRCKMFRICPSCLGFNYFKRGDVRKRDKSMCGLLFAEAQVISAFQIEYYMKKKENLLEEEKVKLKAALRTYKLLADS